MDRRRFLKTSALGAAALVVGEEYFTAEKMLAATKRPSQLKNWAWITVNTEKSADDWKRSFNHLRESGIHAIVPEIYNGREAYFPSQHLPVKTDLLGAMLLLAAAADLEVHAWMWAMPCMIPEMMSRHPDWYNVNAKGESAVDKPAYVDYYKFLDPGRAEVREWIQTTVKELAHISELKGIHLDYIRHPDAILAKGLWKKYNIMQDKVYPPYDYGYTPYERQKFKKRHGIDPLELPDPNKNNKWVRFRLDMVTDLVNDYLVPAAHAKGKMISAAVFPGPSLAREMVRQDWGRWKLDAFLPMLYNEFYEEGSEWVREQTREGVSTVKKPVYSGLFIYNMDETNFTRTAEMALAGGAAGISVFSAEALDESKGKALREITDKNKFVG